MAWFITDDDCLQCCRCDLALYPSVFELVQINSYPGHIDGKPFYQVAHAHIDMKDYTQNEILDALGAYGYKDMDDFVFQNSPTNEYLYFPDGSLDRANSPSYIIDYQLIAEMLFELEAQEYVENEYSSWNDAVMGVSNITGLDLQGYLDKEDPTIASPDSLLIFGEMEYEDIHRAILTTPTELAAEFHMPPERLIRELQQVKKEHGQDANAVYVTDQTRYSLRFAERVQANAQAALSYITSSMQKGNYHHYQTPSPSTCRSLCQLFSPIFPERQYTGQEDHDIMASLTYAKHHPDYFEDLLKVFAAYHLMDVTRERQSTTQGTALIRCAGKEVIRFADDMYLKTRNGSYSNGFRIIPDAQHHGPVISGWGSIKSDADFMKAALVQFPQRICQCLTNPSFAKEETLSLNEQIAKAHAKKTERKKPVSARLKRIEPEL